MHGESSISIDHTEGGAEARDTANTDGEDLPWAQVLRRHLEEFKTILLRELSKSSESHIYVVSNSSNFQISHRTHQICGRFDDRRYQSPQNALCAR